MADSSVYSDINARVWTIEMADAKAVAEDQILLIVEA